MINQTSNAFNKLEFTKVFDTIISVDIQLKTHFDNFLLEEYNNDFDSRLYYVDMGEISRFIVDKIKSKQSYFLKDLFIKVEQILADCDTEVNDLIVVGLFEGIQNTGGSEIDYYFCFDNWLLLLSEIKWDNLIDTWEGTNRRNKNLK
jgi:hypothetical protein